jgi:hypothetical protein
MTTQPQESFERGYTSLSAAAHPLPSRPNVVHGASSSQDGVAPRNIGGIAAEDADRRARLWTKMEELRLLPNDIGGREHLRRKLEGARENEGVRENEGIQENDGARENEENESAREDERGRRGVSVDLETGPNDVTMEEAINGEKHGKRRGHRGGRKRVRQQIGVNAESQEQEGVNMPTRHETENLVDDSEGSQIDHNSLLDYKVHGTITDRAVGQYHDIQDQHVDELAVYETLSAQQAKELAGYETLVAQQAKQLERYNATANDLWIALPKEQKVDFLRKKFEQMNKELEDEKTGLEKDKARLRDLRKEVAVMKREHAKLTQAKEAKEKRDRR